MSLIECDNVITEVGAQDFAFCLSCALLQIGAGPETPTEERAPPSLSSKSFLSAPLSPLLPLAVSPSPWQRLMGSFSPAAPSHPSSGSLPFFFFLCGFIPSGFFEHSELFPLSTLPPASLGSLINYLGTVTCSRWTPFLHFPTHACCLWEPCLAIRMYAHTVAGWVSFAVKHGYGVLGAAALWSSGFVNSVAINP